jgi:pyruvate dehydrogenase E2 component (dihydrolipoyllysine-residue acetyltransferase)
MPIDFKLPDLGEGVAEGEIVKWLVSEGQEIKEDQPMVEVMTDKATVQIPSPVKGKVLRILAKEGHVVKVGTSLIVLEGTSAPELTSKQGTVAQVRPPVEPAKEAPQAAQVLSRSGSRIVATPATRKLARELGVEIELVQGTGAGGRVTDDDVKGAQKGRASSQVVSQTIQTAQVSISPSLNEERIPLHGIRRRIAEKMVKSSRTTAAVTHVDEVDMSELVHERDQLKQIADKQGVKLTYLPFIMRASVQALKEFPFFNSSLDDSRQEIVLKHYYNIGFATDTENGLIVPVVKDADKKKLFQIAKEVEQLSEHARSGRVKLEDIQGGTFTITNIGTLGGIFSTPIINHPEVAILGVQKVKKRPVVKDGQVVVRDIGYISLTFDHRIVDGADAARFTSTIIKYLENPSTLLIDAV